MVSKEELEQAREWLQQIGSMKIVVTVWETEDTSALKNKTTTDHIACDIPDEKPYASLMAFLLNNASELLDKAADAA